MTDYIAAGITMLLITIFFSIWPGAVSTFHPRGLFVALTILGLVAFVKRRKQ